MRKIPPPAQREPEYEPAPLPPKASFADQLMILLARTLGGAAGLIFGLGMPITWLILALDTINGTGSVAWKIFIILVLDGAMAVIWPGIWMAWLIFWLLGQPTSLSRLFS